MPLIKIYLRVFGCIIFFVVNTRAIADNNKK